MKGIVKWFNSQKGYGFIIDETGKDVFVHYSNINMDGYKTLNPDDEVEFEGWLFTIKKIQAHRVERIQISKNQNEEDEEAEE